MIRMSCFASLVCLLAISACGGGKNPPGNSDPPGGGDPGDRISGNERLGWSQSAGNAGELNRMQFVAYVDGNRVALTGAACTGSTSPFQCSSRMPSMSAGAHTIEVATYVMDGDVPLESGRSAPLRVTVVAATAGGNPSNAPTSQQTTADGVALRLDPVATDLQGVTAMALSSDGLLIVGERRGRILIESVATTMTSATSLASNPAAIELGDAFLPAPDVGGLLALALDPAFERTRFVYALYTVEARDGGPGFRIARFREASRQLGERAVLLENLAASPERPAGALGFGADGKLYVSFDDGGAPSQAARASTYSGKLLRLNADGTTPQDQAGRPPVVESDLRSPRGFDWHPGSGALWLADTNAARDALRVRGTSTRSRPAQHDVALPQGTDAAAVAFAKGTLMPILQGDLFVASRQGRHLLRLRIDRRDAMRVLGTERLFADVAGPVNSVVSGVDGALYLGTDTAVLRISPR